MRLLSSARRAGDIPGDEISAYGSFRACVHYPGLDRGLSGQEDVGLLFAWTCGSRYMPRSFASPSHYVVQDEVLSLDLLCMPTQPGLLDLDGSR